MSRTMRAQRLHLATRTITVEDVPVPVPGPGEVLVKVAFCGICHSDLSLIDGVIPTELDVVTQGHEASGTVAELGPGVDGWSVGDRVVVPAGRPCGACPRCRSGELLDCQDTRVMAFGYDGGWAEYTVALAGGLTAVPDGVPLEQAAILADAVSTPYGAVVHTGDVRVGEAVGVWGIGGVGTHVVQLARLVGATPVIALDVDEDSRRRALEVGADAAVDPTDPTAVEQIRELTGGLGLDVAFDTVGIHATFDQALESLCRGGRLVVVGLSGDEVSVGRTAEFTVSKKRVLGHLGYRNPDIAVLVRLVATGRLDLSRSISGVVPLEQVAEGIERLRTRDGNPIRLLVQP